MQHRTHSSTLRWHLKARWMSSTTRCLHSIARITDSAAISSFHFHHVFKTFTACITLYSPGAGLVLVMSHLRLSQALAFPDYPNLSPHLNLNSLSTMSAPPTAADLIKAPRTPKITAEKVGPFVEPSTPSFPRSPHAATTSAWSSSLPIRAMQTPIHPYTYSGSFARSYPSVKELSGDLIDGVTSNLATLVQNTNILRLYAPLDEIPFAFLDALVTEILVAPLLTEIHMCIHSLLRPALQSIYESWGLERGFISAIRKWANTKTTLKFFFLLPGSSVSVKFDTYQDVNLLPAIRGLARGSAELWDILAQAECRSSETSSVSLGAAEHSQGGKEAMEVDG